MTDLLARPDVRFAAESVAEAARLVRLVQADLVGDGLTKSDRSPVTVGDFAAQALVAARLAAHDPAAMLVGEEDAVELRKPECFETLTSVTNYVRQFLPGLAPEEVCALVDRGGAAAEGSFWTLDPIDGTRGFLRRDQYVTALAYIEAGQVKLAAMACPNVLADGQLSVGGVGCVLIAIAGGGCWVAPMDRLDDFARAKVSAVSNPAEALMLGSLESRHTDPTKMTQLVESLGLKRPSLKLDSQAKYALVALGGGDLIVRFPPEGNPAYREKIWDHAAGMLCVEEAGGRVTDVLGAPLDFSQGRALENNRGMLASNGLIHSQAIEALSTLVSSED